ncbi:hypothetical protein D3C87_110420 [compost metagenome]
MQIKKATKDESILLHDFYFESSEPDAPKKAFAELDAQEKEMALAHFSPDFYLAVHNENGVVGFLGLFPDDFDNINIFYVISPDHRGKGYLVRFLELARLYCRDHFPEYKYLRALTRKSNVPSIRALENAAFVRRGECVEEVMPEVTYEEYLLLISQ